MQTATPCSEEDGTEAALSFVRKLLESNGQDQRSLPELLHDLRSTFSAWSAGIGTANPVVVDYDTREDNDATPYPWEGRPDVLDLAWKQATALSLNQGNTTWLLTTFCDSDGVGRLLWLGDSKPRTWSAGDRTYLALAAECLARSMARTSKTTWSKQLQHRQVQHDLEITAAVTNHLSHDFGNLITGILGFAELGMMQTSGQSPDQAYLREVFQSAEQAANWVRRLQQFCRRSEVNAKSMDIAQSTASLETRVVHEWGPDASLTIELSDDLPPVRIDEQSFAQLLAELLDNAHDAISGNGNVLVRGSRVELSADDCSELFGNARPGSYVQLEVSDTGTGISHEHQSRIFREAFFSTKSTRQGGLGLAISYRILHGCGGGLALASQAENGTSVKVYLPVAEDRTAKTVGYAAAQSILVVDDDPVVLDYVDRVLQNAGYSTKPVNSGSEAFKCYVDAESSFGLVISDILMPNMDGFELVQKLMEADANANVLFITSQDRELVDSGPFSRFSVLKKPFGARALLNAVEQALTSHKS